MKTFVWVLGASAVLAVCNWFGFWQVSLLVGVLFALLNPLGRAVLMSLTVGVIGWGAPLAVVAVTGEAVKLAELVGNILGLGNAGTSVILLVPCLVGGLLALMSAWMVGAVRSLFVAKPVTSNLQVAKTEVAVKM